MNNNYDMEIVNKAKRRFNKDLLAPNYHSIHSDDIHLKNLLRLLELKENGKYLDLGTGNGYIAFELAQFRQDCFVHGLDIAEEAIELNNKKVS